MLLQVGEDAAKGVLIDPREDLRQLFDAEGSWSSTLELEQDGEPEVDAVTALTPATQPVEVGAAGQRQHALDDPVVEVALLAQGGHHPAEHLIGQARQAAAPRERGDVGDQPHRLSCDPVNEQLETAELECSSATGLLYRRGRADLLELFHRAPLSVAP
ncbi:MAG: hypothetical protein CO108_07800 [Deltaproteobacteria bacterium CG_4_9_14_3_um_filter_63_12]|nr:MAG: hypothetical protein CO108_07800 [Deltaproteobacteria bacterium CG_4_9_14_3_um_filter_63_12]